MAEKAQAASEMPDRADVFLARFRGQFVEELEKAKAAAETTGTLAWRQNYTDQTQTHRKAVARSVGTIADVAERIKQSESSEDDEKEIKDAVKALAEERVRFLAWQSRSVNPYSASAETCAQIRLAARRAAQEAEMNAPLVDRGLVEAVDAALAKWPVPTWNENDGVMTIGMQ